MLGALLTKQKDGLLGTHIDRHDRQICRHTDRQIKINET